MTLFTFRLLFLQIIFFIYACRILFELFWKNSSYVICIFVVVALYARMFVAGANKVEGTKGWFIGTNEI